MTDYPHLTTQLIFQFLKTRPEFLEYIKASETDPDQQAKPRDKSSFNPNARIVRVIPREQLADPKDIYYVDEADLVPMDSWLSQTDLTDADVALVSGIKSAASDIIEVVYYERGYGRAGFYFASSADMVLSQGDDDDAHEFALAASAGEYQKAFVLLNVLDQEAFTEEGPYGLPLIQCAVNEGGLGLFETMLKGISTEAILCKGSDGSNVLHTIADKGYMAFLQSLITIRPELVRTMANATDSSHRLPLHVAIINSNTEMAEALITHTDLTRFWAPDGSYYETMLLDAIIKQNVRLVELLLGKVQADPDDRLESLLAVDAAITERLVKARDYSIRDFRGNSIHIAANYKSYRIIELVYEALVSVGAVLEPITGNRYTFFNLLIQNSNTEAIHQLVKRPDFDPRLLTIADAYDQTPLHWAAGHGLHDVCELLYETYVTSDLLLKRSKHGATALALAVAHSSIVDLFTRDPKVHTELIGIRNNFGYSPLHLAAQHGCVESCRILYDRMSTEQICLKTKKYQHTGLDSWRTKKYGHTALHVAVIDNHLEVFPILLQDCDKSRALVGILDSNGKTALQLAEEHSPEMHKHLLEGAYALE